MKTLKFFISLVLAVSLLFVQAGGVFAAPAAQAFPPIEGTVQSIIIETDPSTGVISVLVIVVDAKENWQTVRVTQKTALKPLKLIGLDADGKPVVNHMALGMPVKIELTMVIPNQEKTEHPVGSALANVFSDTLGLEYTSMYELIMAAQKGDFGEDDGFESGKGFGFGVIAQALWMTKQLNSDSDADTFKALLLAKQTDNYTSIVLEDDTSPQNWGQLRNAILDGIKVKSLGSVVANQDNNGNANHQGNNQANKDKNKDKNDNGKGNDDNSNKDKEKIK